MAVTHLSPTATPGGVYSFSPKAPADGSTTQVTALSVTALPGPDRSFSAKTPAGYVPTTQVTTLSVTATPGRLPSFVAKAAAPVEESSGAGTLASYYNVSDRIHKDDAEILEMLQIFLEVISE